MPATRASRCGPAQSGDLIPVSCLALDPHHENTLWAGTSDPAFVYRSEDGGATWQLRTRGIAGYVGLTVRSITFSPDEPDVIYAAAEINSKGWNFTEKTGKAFDQAKGIIFRSTDGGSWWLPVWRGDSLANKIVIDPQNSQRVFMAAGAYNKEAGNALLEGDSLAQMGGLGVLVLRTEALVGRLPARDCRTGMFKAWRSTPLRSAYCWRARATLPFRWGPGFTGRRMPGRPGRG